MAYATLNELNSVLTSSGGTITSIEDTRGNVLYNKIYKPEFINTLECVFDSDTAMQVQYISNSPKYCVHLSNKQSTKHYFYYFTNEDNVWFLTKLILTFTNPTDISWYITSAGILNYTTCTAQYDLCSATVTQIASGSAFTSGYLRSYYADMNANTPTSVEVANMKGSDDTVNRTVMCCIDNEGYLYELRFMNYDSDADTYDKIAITKTASGATGWNRSNTTVLHNLMYKNSEGAHAVLVPVSTDKLGWLIGYGTYRYNTYNAPLGEPATFLMIQAVKEAGEGTHTIIFTSENLDLFEYLNLKVFDSVVITEYIATFSMYAYDTTSQTYNIRSLHYNDYLPISPSDVATGYEYSNIKYSFKNSIVTDYKQSGILGYYNLKDLETDRIGTGKFIVKRKRASYDDSVINFADHATVNTVHSGKNNSSGNIEWHYAGGKVYYKQDFFKKLFVLDVGAISSSYIGLGVFIYLEDGGIWYYEPYDNNFTNV